MQHSTMKYFLVLIVVLSTSHYTYAKKYYFDPINGLNANPGTSSQPLGKLYDALNLKLITINDGDTLVLRNGYHGKNIYIDGIHAMPVLIISDGGHHPQLLNTIVAGQGWTFEGLDFSPEETGEPGFPGTFDNGVLLRLSSTSKNIIIKNCNVYSKKDVSAWTLDDWRGKVWSGIWDDGNKNIISNCKIFNIAYALQLIGSRNIIVEKTLVENFSGDGIRVGGADSSLIQYNVIRNSIELDADPMVGNHEDGLQGWGDIVGLVVRGNHISNNSRNRPFAGIMQAIGIFDGSTTNSRFENNVITTEHWHGLTILGAYNCVVINNTVLPYPVSKPYTAGPPWIQIGNKKDGTPSTGNTVRNNLTTTMNITFGSSVSDHNVGSANAPDFVKDFLNLDFHPKKDFSVGGVSIINVGSSDGAPLVDFDGTTRPQGSGFDIGAYEYYDTLSVNVAEDPVFPVSYTLFQNFPNPFNPTTTIQFVIPDQTKNIIVSLKIYDMIGREVATLVNEQKNPGIHSIQWNASGVASGVYFYTLRSGNFTETKKVMLTK